MKDPAGYDALYGDLIALAKRLHISFNVQWLPDCHMFYVTHHIGDGMVRFVMVEFPFDGEKDKKVLQFWSVDDEIAEFLAAIDSRMGRIPLQPCDELGWTA